MILSRNFFWIPPTSGPSKPSKWSPRHWTEGKWQIFKITLDGSALLPCLFRLCGISLSLTEWYSQITGWIFSLWGRTWLLAVAFCVQPPVNAKIIIRWKISAFKNQLICSWDILPILVIALVHMGKKNFAPAVAVPGDISLADIDLWFVFQNCTCTYPELSVWCLPGSPLKCHARDTWDVKC